MLESVIDMVIFYAHCPLPEGECQLQLNRHRGWVYARDADRFQARARVATGDAREGLFKQQAAQLPRFDEYRKKTTRRIPVIVFERV
jgi:hypothetical protein